MLGRLKLSRETANQQKDESPLTLLASATCLIPRFCRGLKTQAVKTGDPQGSAVQQSVEAKSLR